MAAEPPGPFYTLATATGIVIFWRDDKGHGAIACDQLEPWDIWCSFSAIQTSGPKFLTPGERVTVEYFRGHQESFRYVAKRVWRLEPDDSPAASAPSAG
jgi:cold shock CspA family protein